jgi:hypothetical protein
MPDLHVVALIYRLQPSDRVSYAEPPPLVFENETARFRLEKNELRCELRMPVGTLKQARGLIDPIVRDWEIEVELGPSRGELRFTYENAEIIDRTPPTPGEIQGRVMVALGGAYLLSMGNVTGHLTRKKYPDPPMGFHLTPDAESILLRFPGYQDGREPLLSMAYFCLTVVELAVGGRKRRSNAAKSFRIAENVLDKLGNLTNNCGDRTSARKAKPNVRPLTQPESEWIEATVKQLVWRLCDPPSRSERTELTLADLPPI